MSRVTNTSGRERGWTLGRNPGAIEAQEAEGQREVCSEPWQLPVDGMVNLDLVGLGLTGVVPSENDELFIDVTLPDGWRITPTEHHMWSELVDAGGNTVAEVFYKAAYYDRRALIRGVDGGRQCSS